VQLEKLLAGIFNLQLLCVVRYLPVPLFLIVQKYALEQRPALDSTIHIWLSSEKFSGAKKTESGFIAACKSALLICDEPTGILAFVPGIFAPPPKGFAGAAATFVFGETELPFEGGLGNADKARL
jgi:hypothetical protein